MGMRRRKAKYYRASFFDRWIGDDMYRFYRFRSTYR